MVGLWNENIKLEVVEGRFVRNFLKEFFDFFIFLEFRKKIRFFKRFLESFWFFFEFFEFLKSFLNNF